MSDENLSKELTTRGGMMDFYSMVNGVIGMNSDTIEETLSAWLDGPGVSVIESIVEELAG